MANHPVSQSPPSKVAVMIETVTGGRSKAEKGGKRRKDLFGKPPPKYSILLLRGETTGSSTADKLYARCRCFALRFVKFLKSTGSHNDCDAGLSSPLYASLLHASGHRLSATTATAHVRAIVVFVCIASARE
ncbi:hypothetical protein GW17_00004951 [Ensete ventricosum]|nr:hypothetical protein GW17_00004951 [Ensete ventricosum]